MKKIVYTRPDGGLSVVNPAPGFRLPDESEGEFLSRVIAKDVPADATNVAVVDSVPADRTFRNALKVEDGVISHDMDKAREIQRDRLREMRAPLLEKLDVDYLRAIESGDTVTQAAIVAEKQVLRDVTKDPAIALATTAEALKAVVPEVLK